MKKLLLLTLLTIPCLAAWRSPLPDPKAWSGHDKVEDAAEILKLPVVHYPTQTKEAIAIKQPEMPPVVTEAAKPIQTTREELGAKIVMYERLAAKLAKHRRRWAATEKRILSEMAELYKAIYPET